MSVDEHFRLPTGEGAPSEWDPVSNAYLEVDDPVASPDDDGTFMSTSTAGAEELFTFAAFDLPPNTGPSVRVQHRSRHTGGSASMRPAIKVNGIVYYGATVNLSSAYQDFLYEWAANPDTGVTFTDADVEGTGPNPLQQFGVELVSQTATIARCTQCFLSSAFVSQIPAQANLGGMHPGGEKTLLASAARTASANSADQVNHNASGVAVTIDVTAFAATPSVVFRIKYKDTLSGKYVTLLESAAITAVGTTVMRVGPALVAAANLTARDVLPVVWRLEAEHADADSITYSCSAQYTFGGL